MVEDWETSHLDVKCPSQVGDAYDRPFCFQVQSVCVASLSGGGVLALKQEKNSKFFKIRQ